MPEERRARYGRKGAWAHAWTSGAEPKARENPNSEEYAGAETIRSDEAVLSVEEQVTRLFEQFRDRIYRYLMMIVENRYDAEELTQEVFLQLYRCLQKGQTIDNVPGWLFRVAHNYAINQRSRSKHLVALELDSWDELSGRTIDPAPGPEESFLRQETSQRLQAALQELTPKQRECLVLRAEGFRYAEIAEILRITVANVAQSLRRGVTKLIGVIHE